MQHVDDDLTNPRDHLALDESMLLAAESGEAGDAIRIWEFDRHVAVAGRSTRINDEIDVSHCDDRGIPVLRRCSGGASVIGGPGCLMYSVVLGLDRNEDLRRIDVAHQHVMGRVRDAARKQIPEVELQGTCDLTWNNRKCSGNSLRVARRHLLYHGTLLYDFDLSVISDCLRLAPRQPEYRAGRDHDAFVTNVRIDVPTFKRDLIEVFEAKERIDAAVHAARIDELRSERYDQSDWHFRH